MLKKFLFIVLMFCIIFAGGLSGHTKNTSKIAEKIWKNECGGKLDGLTNWNKGENFGSFGIGHFIWYPEGKSERFHETFPQLLIYLQSRGTGLPRWLKDIQGSPWTSLEDFYSKFNSKEMIDLRQFLYETRNFQAEFIASRLENALPKMIEKLDEQKRQKISNVYKKLAASAEGLYAMIDYVNFKGEGLSPSEGYNGQGWGLLQVLEGMPETSKNIIADFISAAKAVLVQRVENSPPKRNEKQWLQGWINRINSYEDKF